MSSCDFGLIDLFVPSRDDVEDVTRDETVQASNSFEF